MHNVDQREAITRKRRNGTNKRMHTSILAKHNSKKKGENP